MPTEITVSTNYAIAVTQNEYDGGRRVYRCIDCDTRLSLTLPLVGDELATLVVTCEKCPNDCTMEIPTYNSGTQAFEWTN